MIEICEKEKCTGCGLCSNVCGFHAIEMKEDSFLGHYRPVINSEKCKECRKCQRLCPSNNRPAQLEPYKTYASWSEDDQERKTSSSGGIVAALYRSFIEQGGNIVGAYLENGQIGHLKVSHDPDDIGLFKGSKYVQVKVDHVYSECLDLLKTGGKVLFAGTPCQCAAMKNCAGNYSDKLFLVELICHGVPTPVSWTIHHNWLSDLSKDKINEVKFRSERFSICLSLTDSKGKLIYQRNKQEDPYLVAFLNGELFAESCFHCPYARKERIADLVVGDFWGIGKKVDFPYPTKKVSVVGVLTEKGDRLLSTVPSLKLIERDYAEAVDGNPQLRAPFIKPANYCDDYSSSVEERIRTILYNKERIQKLEANYKERRRMDLLSSPYHLGKRVIKSLLRDK